MGNSDNGNVKPGQLEFWFDFASTYSYLSAMRIDTMCAAADLKVVWRPFLLGPIFKENGWSTSPFEIYPAKGRHMLRDMERICAARNLPFHMPDTFPANSLSAARIALVAFEDPEKHDWGAEFCKKIFAAEFAIGADIASDIILEGALKEVGADPAEIIAQASDEQHKPKLRAQVSRAQELGIFGAPTFITHDGELFWGDDRLKMAIAHATDTRAN